MPPSSKRAGKAPTGAAGKKHAGIFKRVQNQLLSERWVDVVLRQLGWQQVPWDQLEGTGDCWAIATLANSIPRKKLAKLDHKTRVGRFRRPSGHRAQR